MKDEKGQNIRVFLAFSRAWRRTEDGKVIYPLLRICSTVSLKKIEAAIEIDSLDL
jgi:hypothetical protein